MQALETPSNGPGSAGQIERLPVGSGFGRSFPAGQRLSERSGGQYGHAEFFRERQEVAVAGHKRIACPASASSRNFRSGGSRHSGTLGGGSGTAAVSQKVKTVVEKVLPVIAAQREFRFGTRHDETLSYARCDGLEVGTA